MPSKHCPDPKHTRTMLVAIIVIVIAIWTGLLWTAFH